ncbi:alpha/beta hydrolase [Ktedonobacter racemifer]|uniref:Alpha/beta hydrolase fold protein n=1 Tax=Ktedonobacter racemifer DSM 44963 TaxID=485913 RepID=D6TJY6_KTERA|nr:alpha/beta hydrolase [Ktedonobacter racemifer]EFH89743.1 alpha/beta hydrolase fold protein [Ktedonobacter racemifer DSM 44963]
MMNKAKQNWGRPSWKQMLLGGFVGGGIGVLGAIAGVGLYIVDTLIRPKRQTNFIEQYTFSPFEVNLPAEEVTFPPLYGDYEVSGWFVPSPGATTTILICPGYRGRRSDLLGTCVNLWRAGHNILAFEYYGHGEVVGKPVTLGYREINDFLGAVAYAKQRVPETRLGAVGYSMGAAVALMAAARAPEIEAVVADSPFATHRSPIDYAVRRTLHLPFFLFDWMTDMILWWRAGYHFNQVEPLRDIGRIAPRPVLIIHGLKDSIVNPNDAPLLYKAAGNPKELWLLPDVDHCGAYFEDRVAYVNKLVNFFNLYLKEMPAPIPLPERKESQAADSDGHHFSEAG